MYIKIYMKTIAEKIAIKRYFIMCKDKKKKMSMEILSQLGHG